MVIESKINELDDITNDSGNVIVTIRFNGHIIQFPINPETLKNQVDSESLSEKVEGVGEISIPQLPSLSTMGFSSFFPYTNDKSKAPSRYVEWIKNWQNSKKPAELIVSGLDWKGWDMLVTCESFSYWTNAGEEGDIYFDIAFKEYRPYKAHKIKLLGNQFVLDENNMTRVLGNYDYSLYYETNSGIKDREDTLEVPDEVTTGEDESAGSLCQKYMEDISTHYFESADEKPTKPDLNLQDAKPPATKIEELYQNNKKAFAESLAHQGEVLEASTNTVQEQAALAFQSTLLVDIGKRIISFFN